MQILHVYILTSSITFFFYLSKLISYISNVIEFKNRYLLAHGDILEIRKKKNIYTASFFLSSLVIGNFIES
jgi:hypothetical protein